MWRVRLQPMLRQPPGRLEWSALQACLYALRICQFGEWRGFEEAESNDERQLAWLEAAKDSTYSHDAAESHTLARSRNRRC